MDFSVWMVTSPLSRSFSMWQRTTGRGSFSTTHMERGYSENMGGGWRKNLIAWVRATWSLGHFRRRSAVWAVLPLERKLSSNICATGHEALFSAPLPPRPLSPQRGRRFLLSKMSPIAWEHYGSVPNPSAQNLRIWACRWMMAKRPLSRFLLEIRQRQ